MIISAALYRTLYCYACETHNNVCVGVFVHMYIYIYIYEDISIYLLLS